MKCQAASLASLLAVLVTSVWAGDLMEEMAREFRMYPRAGTNLQTFTGALGGVAADPITASTNPAQPFEVSGSTFTDFQTAAGRSCDNQHNNCANLVNNKSGGATVTFAVSDCDNQDTQCKAAASTATATAFATITTSNAEFDFICEV